MKTKSRMIAIYLPQFHPIKINDDVWGKGFTEWTNVAKARPLFKGHYQPRIPKDLGFYDLRLSVVVDEQARMAREAGIEGFCYWHYWFGDGVMALEKPLETIIERKKPDFPFCVGWANHSWGTSTWNAVKKERSSKVFLEQKYPGDKDIERHFEYLLPMFKDSRYVMVDGKPLFMIFDPLSIPDCKKLIDTWNRMAKSNGLNGIYFVARAESADVQDTKKEIIQGNKTEKKYELLYNLGFNAIYEVPVQAMKTLDSNVGSVFARKVLQHFGINFLVEKHDYKNVNKYSFSERVKKENVFPQIMPHWDNTPRRGKNGYVYVNESPQLFGEQIDAALECVADKIYDKKIIFINSWNEWGEGNYLEPDLKYGGEYLKEIQKKNIIEK